MKENETAIAVSHAMRERLKEEASLANWEFLGVTVFDKATIRIYFKDNEGVYYRELGNTGGDPSAQIFRDLVSHKTKNHISPQGHIHI